jgi:hypothetical protein
MHCGLINLAAFAEVGDGRRMAVNCKTQGIIVQPRILYKAESAAGLAFLGLQHFSDYQDCYSSGCLSLSGRALRLMSSTIQHLTGAWSLGIGASCCSNTIEAFMLRVDCRKSEVDPVSCVLNCQNYILYFFSLLSVVLAV